MEPDPLPWLFFALALLFVGLATALEVIVTVPSRTEIRRKSEQGDAAARWLDELLSATPSLFITLDLYKNLGLLLVGVASGWLVWQSQSQQTWIGVLSAWLGLALCQPFWRTLALRHADPLVFRLTPLLGVLNLVARPLMLVTAQLNVRASQHEQVRGEESNGLTEEARRRLLTTSESPEAIEENEREMIESILEMNETVAREVMVPRLDMVAIEVETSFREALDIVIGAGHSRVPVYEEHIDHIIGILYAKDLLRCFRDGTTDAPIRELLRPPYFIPASKKVDALLQEMQKHRVHIATVVDEYGGTAGLVTIEDIIEEIVGDIQDEYDLEEDAYIQMIGPDTYLLNSRLDVYSLSELLDIKLDTESADTLGGLLFSLMEHVPEQGECVEYQGWRFTVLSLDGRRIEEVRTERLTSHRQEELLTDEQPVRQHSSTSDSLINAQAGD
ncbi:MAG: HlyC/CorC family transporter [Caldilinea sp. CFX5]|nr:HlyC/CorC family transporter [Caldilinea sp. CFX5]